MFEIVKLFSCLWGFCCVGCICVLNESDRWVCGGGVFFGGGLVIYWMVGELLSGLIWFRRICLYNFSLYFFVFVFMCWVGGFGLFGVMCLVCVGG